jgi:hypothetical protein
VSFYPKLALTSSEAELLILTSIRLISMRRCGRCGSAGGYVKQSLEPKNNEQNISLVIRIQEAKAIFGYYPGLAMPRLFSLYNILQAGVAKLLTIRTFNDRSHDPRYKSLLIILNHK